MVTSFDGFSRFVFLFHPFPWGPLSTKWAPIVVLEVIPKHTFLVVTLLSQENLIIKKEIIACYLYGVAFSTSEFFQFHLYNFILYAVFFVTKIYFRRLQYDIRYFQCYYIIRRQTSVIPYVARDMYVYTQSKQEYLCNQGSRRSNSIFQLEL